MKKVLFMLTLVLWQCTSKEKSEADQPSIPEGVTIQVVVTTSLGADNQPLNNVDYLPAFLDYVYVHTTIRGVADGQHPYFAEIMGPMGHGFDDSPAYYEAKGGTLEVASRFSVTNHLADPGEYTLKVYLDREWVFTKQIKKLSTEETTSGAFDPYWKKGGYMALFPAAQSAGSEWKVKAVTTISGSITNLFVTTHNDFNRIFYVQRNREAQDFNIMEYREGSPVLVFHFPNGDEDEPRNIRFMDRGDKLYFYNQRVMGSYNFDNGETIEKEPWPNNTPPPSNNGFVAPSEEFWVSTNAMLNGTVPLVSPNQYCNDPSVMWASWSFGSSVLYYWIDCGQGSDYGFFARAVNNETPLRLLDGIDEFRYPFHFENNGTNFVAFIEQEEGGDAVVKIATQVNYPQELGFGPNITWGREINMRASVKDGNGASLKVDFYPSPQNYLSYEYADYDGSMFGEIEKIGRIKEGDWAGREVYRLFDWNTIGSMDTKVEPIFPFREYTYLVRNENELIVISHAKLEQAQFTVLDLDGKRMKSELFKGATATFYNRLYIDGLHSPPVLDIPNSTVKLERLGVFGSLDESRYKKMFDHPTEGEILVSEPDNGAFYRFNGDGTVTLYEYQYDFSGVKVDGIQLEMDRYASYSNRNCNGQALDMAQITTPDPSRLVEIGTTSANEPVYGYASAQDKGLIDEYDALKESYKFSGQEFESFDEFVKGVPLFLWKDPFGRYVRWINIDYLTPANCEPILYLYPETTTDVTVELGEKVNVMNSIPAFHSNWQLTADSNGTLIDKATARSYNHIFWDGISGHLPPLQKGFVVDTADLQSFFDETLMCLGLNTNESKDFQDAWLKEFKDAPYYFIGFYDRETIDWYAPMTITPAPTTVIRILMDYRPLEESIYVESPVFGQSPERKGFVAVEWAGLKRFPVPGSRIPVAGD